MAAITKIVAMSGPSGRLADLAARMDGLASDMRDAWPEAGLRAFRDGAALGLRQLVRDHAAGAARLEPDGSGRRSFVRFAVREKGASRGLCLAMAMRIRAAFPDIAVDVRMGPGVVPCPEVPA